MKPIFNAILKSGKPFVGGSSYYDTKWLEINEPIERIYYRLPDNNFLILHGYEKYFHLVEATTDLTGKNKGKTKIRNVYLMGKKENKVDSYRITLFESEDSRYKIGDIVRRTFNIEDEAVKKLNENNWR